MSLTILHSIYHSFPELKKAGFTYFYTNNTRENILRVFQGHRYVILDYMSIYNVSDSRSRLFWR